MTYKLDNNWTLWFHEINNNNWKLSSYKKVYTFDDLNTYLNIYRKINNFSAGMFFLMKEKILPIWESKDNKLGGYWSLKISKNEINKVWKDISSQLVGNTLIKEDKLEFINGISLSPKINNCIIKIWLRKELDIEEFTFENLSTKEFKYFKNNH